MRASSLYERSSASLLGEDRVCEQCGDVFLLDQANQRFCGAACRALSELNRAPASKATINEYMERIAEIVQISPGCSARHIRRQLGGKTLTRDFAVQLCVEAGILRCIASSQRRAYWVENA